MRTTIDLPEPLLQNAKRLAAQRRTTLSQIIADALVIHMHTVPANPDRPFQLHTVGGPTASDISPQEIKEIIESEEEEYWRSRFGS